MRGIKHIIQCRCILPTLKNRDNPPLHQFVVFSIIGNDEYVEEKYVQCNNCGIVHKVTDICRSEIMGNREDLKSALTLEDIKLSLPNDVKNILDTYKCDLPTYEHVKFMYENSVDEFTVLTKELNDEETRVEGKILRYKNGKTFCIEPFSSQDMVQKK